MLYFYYLLLPSKRLSFYEKHLSAKRWYSTEFSSLYQNDSNNIIQLKESISKDTALTIKEKNKKYDDALTYFFDSNLFLMKMKEMKYIRI